MVSIFLPFLSLLLLPFAFFQSVFGDSEVRALMEVKASLDPENLFLTSWSIEGDPCKGSFEGVACNEKGKVANISLQGRGLPGSVPTALLGLKYLSGLYLHYNSLTGEIPIQISNLTDLSDLYLNMNNLSGKIPKEIGNMGNLQVLQLSYNQLSGSMPTQLGFLKKLSVLALQSNQLSGAIPASLGDLVMLRRVDLSFNHLFGSIPRKLAEIPQLEYLDVRNNSLSGNVPSDLTRLNGKFEYANNMGLCGVGFSSLSDCESSDQLNPHRPEPFGPDSIGLSSKSIPQSANVGKHCIKSNCSSSSKSPAVAIVMGLLVVVGATVVSLFAFSWYRRQKQKIGSTFEISDTRLSTDHAKECYRKSGSPLISLDYSNGWDPLADSRSGTGFSQEVLQSFRFNIEEVESATQYFAKVNMLGKSNFGAIYKGTLRDGSVVAVRSINKSSCKSGEAEFLEGLKILTLLQHENLVGLKGFCFSRGRGECFLIYDFIANGSLSQYLDTKKGSGRVLEWPVRVRIINGIAKGIDYLHCNKPNKPALVHQNLSTQKVLVDRHFKPLLSDSGLHKLLADDVVFSTLKASAAMGYLAPEYTTIGRFTEKSDIYAFGVIILQVLSGKGRITNSMRLSAESGNLEDLIDENLHGNFCEHEVEKLSKMAIVCTNDVPSQRPTMEMIIQELSKCSSSNT